MVLSGNVHQPGIRRWYSARVGKPGTPMDLRSIPAEVHAFESHPSHRF